ncbi:hypothetical protein QYE76_051064 [Lolium multiflorum]|uniref:CCHC-type domain-containing protein n=1 Tax=Lolium multiflorum TaxID=4521 RepID=A0AAD8WK61_LOLMU|nr:hypothetical protein QYE76_051064 [Lolium multiflorum]
MASPSINFNQFLEKEKLKSNGSNFTDWFRHVRIFLNGGNLQYVLDAPLGSTPPPVVSEEEKNVFEARAKVYSQVQCAILCSLEAELQKRFEHHDPCDMMRELKVIFETHAAVESYEASKQFFGCMMEEGSSVSEHMFAMSGHARKLSDLGIVIPNQLGIHRVLQSLPPSYKNFVMNYNMQNMNKELPELFSMLKSAEVEIQKEHQVLMVNKTTKFKKQGKPKKDLKKGGKKVAAHPEKPKGGPKPDTDCYYCNGKGHWKRNCSKYLADLKSGLVKKKKGISDIHVIDVYLTGSRTSAWSSAVPEDVPVPPAPVTEEANDNDHETSNEVATEPRRSTRERTTPDWYDPCLNLMIVDNNDEDPATYEEAMMSPDSNKWQEAMKSEMGSMYDNKVWTLVDLPDSRKAVENKWIFKRKTDADGNVTVYKARLVAKGFRQIQGVDYDETFSPVAKLKSVRILLAIAAFFDYEIWQMDVKTAFLNGDIEEELYMVQPKGFVDPKNANMCHGEACIYKKVSGSSVAFLILYVDDILLIGNDIELLSSVKGYLNKCFSMKDLGEAAYILGIKIYRDRSRRLIGLSQSTYLDKILKKFRMDESKKGFLPMLPGKVLSKTQGPATAEERERMNQIPYASAVGSIMYAMLCTRPDIAHAVSLTSRYQSDPGMEHWTAVKNILKYLKRTKDMFLCYGGDQELVVTSYTDASWNTDPDDSKSQSGYVFILNGAAVSWCSSKQCTVAKSSTESEYIAASEASSEAVWMKRFIVELGVVPSALDPLVIYCDNMGAIANAQEPRSHKKLKHIKLRFHSIREYIEDGEVKICKVHTDLNVADPLTKALPRAKHDQHQNAMGVRSNVDPNNVPLASLVAQEENVDVNFIKNNNFNNNAYRNNYGNNYRPYPSANGNGYGNSYGNSYNNNRSVPSGLEAMLKEFISTQTAFNKSVEEKLDKIDTIASRVDRLASDVNLLKLKVMPNNDIDNKITTTENAIQVRINENIRLMAELRARWDREENEKLAKENNVAKVWTITTTSNANSSHVAAPPTINGKIIGVGNVSTPSAKRTKLPEIAKTAETACDKTAEIFSNLGNNDPIAVAHNDLDFDDCHISEVIKFLQKLAKSPNASAINLAFTKHITNALIKAREEKLKLETSIPRKLEDGWEPIIKMKFNDFECNALCDLGASISVMPKKIYDMLDLPPLKNCYLDVNLADNVKKKPLGRIDNVHITVNNNLVPVDFVVLDIECNASCPIVLGRPFLRTVGAVIDMREGSFQGSREEYDILRSRGVKALSLGMPPWFTPAYFKKTQVSKLGDAQGIPFFIDNIIRNPSKEIFSELDEIFAKGPIFARSFQKTEDNEVGPRGGQMIGRRGLAPGRATLSPGPLVWPPDLPFRLLKASVAKTPVPRATIRKTFRDAPPRIPSRGIQEIAPAPCRERGFISRGLFIAMIASGVMSE